MSNPLKIILLISSILLLNACQKEAGEGGNATITGKVITKVFNLETFQFDTIPIVDRRVYIIYGLEENRGIDQDTRTSFDGSFQFDYLRKGDYRIFTYTDCIVSDTCLLGSVPQIKETTINDTNEEVILDDFVITDL